MKRKKTLQLKCYRNLFVVCYEIMDRLPQHLQLKVLSLLDDGAFNKVVQVATEQSSAAPVRAPDKTFLCRVSSSSKDYQARRAVEELKVRGLAVFDDFLGADAAAATRAAADDIAGSGLMRKARMGKDVTQWADARARGDDMIWVNDLLALPEGQLVSGAGEKAPEDAEVAGVAASVPAGSIAQLASAVAKLKEVGADMTSTIGGQFECSRMTFQLSRYADGARYVRHSDVGAQTADRRITCIYYMNPNWKIEHGGELRVYLPLGSTRGIDVGLRDATYPCDVAPLMDRLILFRSEIEHEVLPSR